MQQAVISRLALRTALLAFLVGAMAAVLPGAAARANPVVVFDAATGKTLVAHEAGRAWHPASLTKLLTAYVVFRAIQQGKLKLSTKVRVTKSSSAPPPSKIGFKPGTEVSVEFALKALLVYSANDMAALLAEAVSGSQQDFAKLMNATAHELGMSGSHFVNPHGLHNGKQVTTARDIAVLAYALIHQFPQYSSYYSAPFVKVGKRKLRNRNYLLRIWDKADGMKTGFICPSGFNLVASANVGGRKLVAVIFGTRSGKARARKAKVVLENAGGLLAGKPITALRNTGGKPPNLRKTVCGGKGLKMVRASDVSGWGATFGKFKSAAEAEAVIKGIQAVRSSELQRAGSGVVRVPFTKDYVPVIFRASRQISQSLCQKVQASGGGCEVVSPSVFTQFASLAAREQAKGGKPSSAPAKANAAATPGNRSRVSDPTR